MAKVHTFFSRQKSLRNWWSILTPNAVGIHPPIRRPALARKSHNADRNHKGRVSIRRSGANGRCSHMAKKGNRHGSEDAFQNAQLLVHPLRRRHQFSVTAMDPQALLAPARSAEGLVGFFCMHFLRQLHFGS